MENIKKILAVATVVAMVCASIVMVSPNIMVTAEDSAKPIADLNNGYPGNIEKVAWHEDGSYALGIVSGTDHIYRYTRQTMSWASEHNEAGGNTFMDIKYSLNSDFFYIVGYNGAQPMAWRYMTILEDLGAPNIANAYFNGLGLTDAGGMFPNAFLAVGYDPLGGAPYAAWFQEPNTWTPVTTGWAGDHILHDIEWNQDQSSAFFYMVGEGTGGTGIIYYLDSPVGTSATQYVTNMTGVGELYAIDYQDGDPDSGLIAGANLGSGNAWTFDFDGPVQLLNSTDVIQDIRWHPDDPLAMLVGYTAGSDGVIYHYNPANNNAITKMSKDGDYGQFYGVDVKGWTSPSSGLIVGSGGAVGSYLSASNTDTRITVNVAFPHMFAIDMWDMADGGQTSTLNTPVDVIAGETYTFYSEVNYTIGGVDQIFDGANINNTFLNLTAWFDDGAVSLTPPLSDDVHRTRKFVARVYEGVGGPAGVNGEIIYPDTTTNEFVFHSVGCSGPLLPTDHYAFWINVTFGPQTRAADGTGFAFGSGDIYDNTDIFNDLNSWNFAMTVYDNDFSGATNTTYEEFGINMATNITAAGMPSVNAPPGSVSRLLAPNSFITYSANTPYYVNVSIVDLTSGGNTIFATNVNVSLVGAYPAGFNYNPYTELNASWGANGRPFAGAGAERMVWGNATENPNHLLVEPNNGTSAHGPIYSNFDGYGATELNWWVNVPAGTNEGIYQSIITFKIGFY